VDADRFIILISHERSGSHYVSDMLMAASTIQSVDEVCNFNAVNPESSKASFLGFKREAGISNPDIVLRPSPSSMGELLGLYLGRLQGLVKPEKQILIDVKYGHVHNFEIGWWPSERRPFLLQWLEQRDIKIVHLSRRDSLAATVSGYIADKRRVWHRKTGDEVPATPPVRVPVQRMVHEALLLEGEKQNFVNWLAGNRCFHLEYETVAGEGRDSVMNQLCSFLAIPPPVEFVTTHMKVTPPLAAAVENYSDLINTARLFGGGRLRLDFQ
jgi:hypothetical protein